MPIKTTFRGGDGADRGDDPHGFQRFKKYDSLVKRELRKDQLQRFPPPSPSTDHTENPTTLPKGQFK